MHRIEIRLIRETKISSMLYSQQAGRTVEETVSETVLPFATKEEATQSWLELHEVLVNEGFLAEERIAPALTEAEVKERMKDLDHFRAKLSVQQRTLFPKKK